MMIKRFTAAAILSLAATAALAGEVQQGPGGTTVWQAGVDGVEIEWGPDGSFNRVYSLYTQPVGFPDRRGISKAQTIAEEKAKGAVVRFIDQEVSTSRVVTQVDEDLETATRSQGSGAETFAKTNERKLVESLKEVTQSVAKGSLRGVIVLERGYDEKREEAWVKVGISRKTIATAGALQDAFSASHAGTDRAAAQGGPGAIHRPGSEVRRTNQADW